MKNIFKVLSVVVIFVFTSCKTYEKCGAYSKKEIKNNTELKKS